MANELSNFPLILLAGGKSSRVGTPKGLIPFEGSTWLERQCESFRSLGGTDIVLVLGYDAGLYSDVCSRLKNIETVINFQPEHGPFSSIQTGVDALMKRDFTGAFILPIDVPVPDQAVWKSVSDALDATVRYVQACYREEGRLRGGHPVLISKSEALEVLKMPPTGRLDGRLREVSAMTPEAIRKVEVFDSSVLLNLNTREDWESYKVTLEHQ